MLLCRAIATPLVVATGVTESTNTGPTACVEAELNCVSYDSSLLETVMECAVEFKYLNDFHSIPAQ